MSSSSRDQDRSPEDGGGGEDLNKSRSDRDDHDESYHYKRHKVSSRNAHSRHERLKGQERMARIDEHSSSFHGGMGPETGESSNTASRRPRPRPSAERSNVGSRYHDDNDNHDDDMQEPPSRYPGSSSSSASSRLRPSERPNADRYHDDSLVRARSDAPSPSRGHRRGFERVPSVDDQGEESRSRQRVRQSDYYDDDDGWPEERSGPARIRNRLLSEDGSGMTDAEIDDCLDQLDEPLPVHLHRTERSRGTVSMGKEKGKGKGKGKGKEKARHHGK